MGGGLPWFIIACCHNMESSQSFAKHLHEGSSLQRRTRWIPKGRPKTGSPPFTWEVSAVDAMRYDRFDRSDWSTLPRVLYNLERYNGTGYLRYHRSTPSPYLWSGTTVSKPGKYVADGKWSSTAISKQVGCAAILKALGERGVLS